MRGGSVGESFETIAHPVLTASLNKCIIDSNPILPSQIGTVQSIGYQKPEREIYDHEYIISSLDNIYVGTHSRSCLNPYRFFSLI